MSTSRAEAADSAATSCFQVRPPAYTDYAFNTIGGSASVTGLRTCWDGFSHNTVGGNVQLVDNQTAIEDGNLVTAISSGTI